MIHKHFKTKAKFNEELAKSPSGISDSDICFIKDTGEIWTHGKIYAGSDALAGRILALENVGATKTEASETNGNIKINGTETTVYTHPVTTATTAAAVKVGNDAAGHVVLGDAISASDVGAIASTLKGAANGLAELDAQGKVPSSQLPSYVDDVIEGYLYNGKFYKESTHTTEITGEGGKIYVDLATEKTYRWSGSAYAQIKGDLVIGTSAGTAADGKVVADHVANTTVHITAAERTSWNAKGSYSKPSGGIPKKDLASSVQESLGLADSALQSHQDISGKADKSATVSTVAYDATNKKITKTINGTTTDVVTVSTLKTDLSLTKSDVGLGNVGNFKAVSTVASQGLSSTEQSNARANIGAGVGTITGIKMNGSSKGSSGVVDLGTVITSHQDISGKADVATTLAGYGITDAYTKAEVNALVTTPNVEYVTVEATQQTTAATDVLPATGSADTIYRVANWGGSQYDATAYCEYAWNGSAYVLLSVHSVQAGVPVVLQSSSTALIEPNKYNLWATPVAALEISFAAGTSGYVNEYIIDFTCPSNAATVLTLPSGVVWANDDDLEPEAGMRYQISILDNLAVYAGWEAAAS